jgi:phosphatidate cytidylyltransferase
VSARHSAPSSGGHAPGYRAIRFNMDWITRPLFGILLGLFTLSVVFYGPKTVAIAVAIAFALGAIEWHRCIAGGAERLAQAALTALSVATSEAVLLYAGIWAALLVVAVGTIAALVLALKLGEHPFWHAAGTPYLALPALSLVALCGISHGLILVGLLLIVWATDTGALIFGNLIGGPRLAPKLSPAKTWAGTIGGSLVAALVFTFYLHVLLGGSAAVALAFGFLFSFSAHAGDLVESFVKRRFGVKNSGNIIPGHGGILDRIDSTLMAAPVMALLVFVAHFNPLTGVHA